MAWNNVTDTTQTWTVQTSSVATWTFSGQPSVASRLNRIFPQTESAAHTPGELDFIYRVNSDGYWFVATANRVYVKSSITHGV